MIKSIHIKNIKGIHNKNFILNIIPNKPSLLVAPNGYGKSSIATAFNSMNNNRILLSQDDFYRGNIDNKPQISIKYKNSNNIDIDLIATNNSNRISDVFDYFVINSQLKPKGIGSQYGRASARLEIKDVVLVDRIPSKGNFRYKYNDFKSRFGRCGQVLPNARKILDNLIFIEKISLNTQALKRANGTKIQQRIRTIIKEINNQKGSAKALSNWVTKNQLDNLKSINYLNIIANIIHEMDFENNSETNSYLIAIQIIWLYNDNPNEFIKVCKYHSYLLEKQRFDETLSTFNCTWKNIHTVQTKGKLIVKFPEAIHISNGQRDILSFISMLFRAQKHLKKDNNILIIDEVFDYLDDANLITAQYYITNMIKQYKDNGKKIYPLILTHLNPNYFKNFAFRDQKVYYLNKSDIQPNKDLVNLLKKRKNIEIKDDISKYLLHYYPDMIDRRDNFRKLGIKELWGESNNFYQFLLEQLNNYLTDKKFCPLAVCGAVRIKIEKVAYNKLQNDKAKELFITTYKTREKLNKVEEMGINCPESHYLLGIIYNEGMHWKDNIDMISPIASKLENITIKKLIKDIFNKEDLIT